MFDVSETPATASLSEAAADISRDYEQIIPLIGRVRDAVTAISSQAEVLVQTIESADGENQDRLIDQDTLEEICGATQRAAEILADPKLPSCCQALAARLKDAGRHALELSIVSVLVKTSSPASDLTHGEPSDFAGMVDELVKSLEKAIGEASRQVDPIRHHITSAGEGVSVAAQSLRDALKKCSSGSDESRNLLQDRTAYLASLKAASTELAATCRSQIGRLVPSLQFSDELTQRIDNVARIAAAIAERDEGHRPASWALVARLTQSLIDDHREINGQAENALQQMIEAATSAGGVLAPGNSRNAAERWLDDRRGSVSRVSHAVSAARTRLKTAENLLDAVEKAGERASDAIADFQALIAQLDLAAVNAAIAAGRASEAGGALQFLSGQVQQIARNCADRLRGSRDALGTISGEIDTLDRKTLMSGLDVLSQSQSASESAVHAQDACLQRQGEIQADLAAALKSLSDNSRKAHQLMQRGLSADGALLEALQGNGTSEIADPSVAEWMWSFYTTEAERRVHKEFVGREDEPEAAGTSDDADEFDDFLL